MYSHLEINSIMNDIYSNSLISLCYKLLFDIRLLDLVSKLKEYPFLYFLKHLKCLGLKEGIQLKELNVRNVVLFPAFHHPPKKPKKPQTPQTNKKAKHKNNNKNNKKATHSPYSFIICLVDI